MTDDRVVRALVSSLTTPNEKGKNFREANVADGLFAIALAIEGLTGAIERFGGSELLSQIAAK
jgi:hypothetical protein